MSTTGFITESPSIVGVPSREYLVNEKKIARSTAGWKAYERFLFRIAFIFFIVISIPNSPEWYYNVIHINWTSLHYRDLYDIARFGSGFTWFGNTIFGDPLLGYAIWIINLGIAITGAVLWTLIAKWVGTEKVAYNNLYYWLRAIVRYRAAIGIIGFGFTKLLPVQMPYPSLGVLNTNFGDLTAQKIYWLSIGIVPWYQVFAGVVEVTAGALLFFRKTTTLGSILLFGALGDIVYVNFAYDGGVHVYSSYFVLLAGFLLIQDVPKIYSLFINEKFTIPANYYPAFPKWLRYVRISTKALVLFLFIGVLFWLQLVNFWYDPYKQPSVAGVKQLRGNYAVTEFRINNQVIPYSPFDSTRWNEATFENWSSFTFRVNKPTALDLSNGGGDPQRDVNRTFELTGVAGGQRVFHYYADEASNVLYLEDKFRYLPARDGRAASGRGTRRTKNESGAVTQKPDSSALWIPDEVLNRIGNEAYKIDERGISTRRLREYAAAPKTEKRNHMVLEYETQDGSHVILKGINENRDSIYVVLDRIDKNYVLKDSKLQAGKY